MHQDSFFEQICSNGQHQDQTFSEPDKEFIELDYLNEENASKRL